MNLKSPFGWSQRYAAAEARKAEQAANAANNMLRHLHIQKCEAERELKDAKTKAERDALENRLLEIELEMEAVGKDVIAQDAGETKDEADKAIVAAQEEAKRNDVERRKVASKRKPSPIVRAETPIMED